jgi:hypothetical protein
MAVRSGSERHTGPDTRLAGQSRRRFSRGAILAWLAGEAQLQRPPGELGDA